MSLSKKRARIKPRYNNNKSGKKGQGSFSQDAKGGGGKEWANTEKTRWAVQPRGKRKPQAERARAGSGSWGRGRREGEKAGVRGPGSHLVPATSAARGHQSVVRHFGNWPARGKLWRRRCGAPPLTPGYGGHPGAGPVNWGALQFRRQDGRNAARAETASTRAGRLTRRGVGVAWQGRGLRGPGGRLVPALHAHFQLGTRALGVCSCGGHRGVIEAYR